jgi:hypothetical protein
VKFLAIDFPSRFVEDGIGKLGLLIRSSTVTLCSSQNPLLEDIPIDLALDLPQASPLLYHLLFVLLKVALGRHGIIPNAHYFSANRDD